MNLINCHDSADVRINDQRSMMKRTDIGLLGIRTFSVESRVREVDAENTAHGDGKRKATHIENRSHHVGSKRRTRTEDFGRRTAGKRHG